MRRPTVLPQVQSSRPDGRTEDRGEKRCRPKSTYEANKARYAEKSAAWRATNKERERARKAAWYANNRERVRVRGLAWVAAHPEQARASDTAWREKNKEKEHARHVAYYAENREKVLERQAACRAASPERHAARLAVRDEIRTHRWPPANMQVCEICGEAQAQQYHHHLGYEPEHWLHTQAVCRECHGKAHRHVEEEG